MKTISSLASLSAAALLSLGGCNLTYDREGTKFERPSWPPSATPLTIGVDAPSNINPDAAPRYFVLAVPAGGLEVRFQTFDYSYGPCSTIDPMITVYDAAGNYLGQDDDTGIGYCADMALTLAEGTYYVEVSHAVLFGVPFDFVVRASSGPIGGSAATLSCNRTDVGYCDQTSGTLTLADVVDFEYDCDWYGFTAAQGACPASTLSGHCLDSTPPYAGADYSWTYYAPWTQSGAENDCVGYGTWVGGDPMGSLACDTTSVNGICQTLIGPTSEVLAAQSGCTAGGGTPLGSCPAGALPGYCSAGTVPGHASVTVQNSYYAPTFSSSGPAAASCSAGGYTWVAPSLVVEPLFPVNGANWNDWVPGTTFLDATDTPCDPASAAECVHAGEIRVVKLPGATSCAGLSAIDQLGWYGWLCDASTGSVRFVAQRLRGANVTTGAPEARLADLIDAATLQWLQNSVTVNYYDGVSTFLVGQTPMASWWSNPIASLPTDGRLAAAGTIYVADGTVQAPVQVQANKVGFTVVRGALLRPASATWAVVDAASRDFLWIEGALDSSGTTYGVRADAVRRSVLRSIDVTRDTLVSGSGSTGIYVGRGSFNRLRILHVTRHQQGLRLEGSSYNDVRNVQIADCGEGIKVEGSASGPSSRNAFRTVAVAASLYDGVYVNGELGVADYNSFDGVTTSNNGFGGVRLRFTRGTSVANAVSAFNAVDGVVLENCSDVKVTAVTSVGNGQSGVLLRNSTYNVLSNAATLYGRWGLVLETSWFNTVVDLATSLASQTGVSSMGTAGGSNFFYGSLVLGANGTPGCACDAASCDPSLVGYDDNCNPGTGDFTALMTPAFGNSFVPAPVAFDASNTSYVNPSVTIFDMDAAFDWTGFENVYRTWGPTPLPLPPALPGPLGCAYSVNRVPSACTVTWNGTATIYDWALVATDGLLRDRLAQPGTGTLPTGDTFTHVGSDMVPTAYLRHAVERGTVTGANGDGLCGSGEPCLFTPNYGAYQGHGNLFYLGLANGSGFLVPASLYRYDPASNGY